MSCDLCTVIIRVMTFVLSRSRNADLRKRMMKMMEMKMGVVKKERVELMRMVKKMVRRIELQVVGDRVRVVVVEVTMTHKNETEAETTNHLHR